MISTVALVVLYLAFLLSEQHAWVEKLPRLAGTAEGTKQAQKVLGRISTGVKQYMWVNAVTSAMSGAVAFLIFSWIGLDFAPLLALTVFVAGFIPNIGAFIGIALPVAEKNAPMHGYNLHLLAYQSSLVVHSRRTLNIVIPLRSLQRPVHWRP